VGVRRGEGEGGGSVVVVGLGSVVALWRRKDGTRVGDNGGFSSTTGFDRSCTIGRREGVGEGREGGGGAGGGGGGEGASNSDEGVAKRKEGSGAGAGGGDVIVGLCLRFGGRSLPVFSILASESEGGEGGGRSSSSSSSSFRFFCAGAAVMKEGIERSVPL